MRRLLVIAVLAGALAAGAVALGACGSDGDGPYRVRAIFDDASFLVAGEDVKVAGVRVGKIDELSVTPDKQAAVVLRIEEPGYQDFRSDAACRIRPQSLIGEQFVECTPTQPRAATDPVPPPLTRIGSGPGEGQRLLPVERTSTSVALDLLANINRLPVRQRLTLIINELGVGLAGRGEDLNAVLRRSAPALQELNQALAILAEQNATLERLADDSDRVLAPLARDRRRITGFIDAAQQAARATVQERDALARSFERFPRFLAELRPTMQRLGELAEQGTPLAGDLRLAAADVDALLRELGPFSAQATPALRSLGEVGERGIPAVRAALPVVERLGTLGRVARPVGRRLSRVLVSFQRNQGIPRLMDFIYFTALSINGFDEVSHFLRAQLFVNTCANYALTSQPECLAKFPTTSASAAATEPVPAGPRDEVLARVAAVLAGEDPNAVQRAAPAAGPGPEGDAVTGGAAAPEDEAAPGEAVLGYLFGEDAR